MSDITEFRLPDVGEGLEEAEIVEWLVAEGDTVARDQPLVEILTDKSQAQIPSPVAGTVRRLGAGEGERLAVGAVLVELDAPGGARGTPPESTRPTPPTPSPSTSPAAAPGPTTGRRVKASPSVRRQARERGIDLTDVAGTGEGGRILLGDLDAPAAPPMASPPTTPRATTTNPPPAAGRHPLRGIRRLTAETMAAAWAEVPHIHVHDEIDASALIDARRRLRDEIGEHLTMLPLLCLAVARALRRNPAVNASIDTAAGHYDVHGDVHLGVAVAAPQGLVVPVVRDAGRRRLDDLTDELGRLVAAARAGTIGVEDLRGATATVTNYGSHGGRFAAPIIRPPEACIVGFGSVAPRPVVVDGEVVARPTLPVSIGADHRLIDGAELTVFQSDILRSLADPVLLLS